MLRSSRLSSFCSFMFKKKESTIAERLDAIGHNPEEVPDKFCCSIKGSIMNKCVLLNAVADQRMDISVLSDWHQTNPHNRQENCEVIPDNYVVLSASQKLFGYQILATDAAINADDRLKYETDAKQLKQDIFRYNYQTTINAQILQFTQHLENLYRLMVDMADFKKTISLDMVKELFEGQDIQLDLSALHQEQQAQREQTLNCIRDQFIAELTAFTGFLSEQLPCLGKEYADFTLTQQIAFIQKLLAEKNPFYENYSLLLLVRHLQLLHIYQLEKTLLLNKGEINKFAHSTNGINLLNPFGAGTRRQLELANRQAQTTRRELISAIKSHLQLLKQSIETAESLLRKGVCKQAVVDLVTAEHTHQEEQLVKLQAEEHKYSMQNLERIQGLTRSANLFSGSIRSSFMSFKKMNQVQSDNHEPDNRHKK